MIVVWYRADTLLSRLIQTVTRSHYSHVALLVNGCLYEALGSGIRKRCGADGWGRVREGVAYRSLPASAADAAQAQRWLDSRVGNGYSFLGFLAAGLGTLTGWRLAIRLDGRYICSGLVAAALQLAGYLAELDPDTMTPADLAATLGTEPPPWKT